MGLKIVGVPKWDQLSKEYKVQSALGLPGDYHNFVHHYMHVAWPGYHVCILSTMVTMGGWLGEPQSSDIRTVHIAWSGEALVWCQITNHAFCKLRMLALPEDDSQYILHADTSQYVVGVVQLQVGPDGETIVIAGWSRTLINAETWSPTYDRELLEIQNSVGKWHYLVHSDQW